MPGQPIQGDHPDPAVHRVELRACLPLQEVFLQRTNLPQRLAMVENQQVFRDLAGIGEINLRQPLDNLIHRGRIEPRAAQEEAQRVDVASERDAPQQTRFDDRRPAPHEWVVNNLPGLRQPLDEEARQLRLEACPIGNLVQTAGCPLLGRPKLIDEGGDVQSSSIERRGGGFDHLRAPAELAEGQDLLD